MIELSKGGAYLLMVQKSLKMAAMQQQNSQQSWETQHLLRKKQQRIQLPIVF